MNKIELEKLIAQGESEELEFKSSLNGLEDGCKTLCGFLNGHGGRVLIGVRNDGTLHGVEYTDQIQKNIAQHFKKFDPAAPLTFESIAIDSGLFVIMLIAQKPYTRDLYQYDGRIYERVGSTKQIMPMAKQQNRLLEKVIQGNYEQLPTEGSLSDLDIDLIKTIVDRGIAAKRISPEAENELLPELLDKRFGLMKSNKLLNGAFILFGKHLSHYPQCIIKMISYRGTDESDQAILDNMHISGNIFKLLFEAQSFINRFTSVKTIFSESEFQRIDVPQIPPLALREILVNALIHRDYSARDGYIFIKIFSNRLEIWNTGLLSSELSLDALKHAHVSKPRNPSIARVLYYDQLVESWGKGTNRVIRLCLENHMPEPQFTESNGGFMVTVHFESEITMPLAGAVPKIITALSDTEQALLSLFKGQEELSFEQIKIQFTEKMADRTLRRYLMGLKSKGFLSLVGRGRYARWQISGQK